MAKPKLTKKQRVKKIKQRKRRRDKRAKNSVRSPLAPTSPKALRKQAQSTMRQIYKPAFKQLGNEEKRLKSVSAKRKSDNAYYLTWLDGQTKQLMAHQDSANAALAERGKEAGERLEQGYSEMRDKLLATGEQTPGVVSDVGDATAFDVSGAAEKDRQQLGAIEDLLRSEASSDLDTAALANANNFATIAAAEAQRQGELWEGMSKLGDAKQQLRLSRGADAAKEVARLLDREIQKTQIRGQLQSSAAQAALEAKRFGLDVEKLNLDIAKFDFDRRESNRNFGLAKQKQSHTEDYHQAQLALEKATTREEKMKASRQITSVIQEGISTIASNPKLQKRLNNPDTVDKVRTRLRNILGSATAANAAVELVSTGKLNPTTRSQLRQIGYIIPKKWR